MADDSCRSTSNTIRHRYRPWQESVDWAVFCLSSSRRAVFRKAGLRPRTKNGVIMAIYVWIAIGSAIGGVARFWCSGTVARLIGETFPFGTLIVNIVGSFIIGFFATLTGPDGRIFASSTARQFVMTGICGGYTTFSSFSLQTLNLINDGEWLNAGANITASVVLCLFAVWAGHVFALGLNSMKWV
jgi:fluoride exporter